MNRTYKLVLALLVGFFVVILSSVAKNEKDKFVVSTSRKSDKSFVHPGILSTQAELDKVKTNRDKAPWKSILDSLKKSSSGNLNYQLQGPMHYVVRGKDRYGNNSIGWAQHGKDATACYVQALLGYVTENHKYTQNAIRIINAWSSTLDSIGGDVVLLSGGQSMLWSMAGELLAHTPTGWKAKDVQKAKDMLYKIFLPPLFDFSPENGANFGTSCIFSIMAMAVFRDDRALFQHAWDAFVSKDGCPNDFSLYRNIAPNGQNVESGRDQVHSWASYCFLGAAATIAANQGEETFGLGNNRLFVGFEYWCKYNLGEEVSFDTSVYRCRKGWGPWTRISEQGRGLPFIQGSVANMIVHAYHTRGFEMNYTKRVATKLGPTIAEPCPRNGWGSPFIADALLYNE